MKSYFDCPVPPDDPMFKKVFFAFGSGIVRSEKSKKKPPEKPKVDESLLEHLPPDEDPADPDPSFLQPRPDPWAILASMDDEERNQDPTFLQPRCPRPS